MARNIATDEAESDQGDNLRYVSCGCIWDGWTQIERCSAHSRY